MIKVSALMDNYTSHTDCFAEHGLSFFIETPDKKILYDTGQTNNFIHNAEKLNVPINKTDFLVISHGHYDHTGGLMALLELVPSLKIIAHPDIFIERYVRSGNDFKTISNPFSQQDLAKFNAEITLTNKPYNLAKNIFTLGEVEDMFNNIANKHMFKDENGKMTVDYIKDDLSIVIKQEDQINIICGCSHSGILNIVDKAINMTGIETVNYIIGGLHFFKMSNNYIKDTIYELNNYDIRNIAVSHCTGVNLLFYLQDNLASEITYFGVGDSIVIR
ncbi:MAG: MBL fold metallo-hydrolase [Cyanobacteriota bacterium]